MAGSFNALLRAEGVDPAAVSLLRHQTNKGANGRTPFMLWQDSPEKFELYQSTQKVRPIFRDIPFWAAFVSPNKDETLFVGLYEMERVLGGVIDWLDPLTDRPVGYGENRPYDLYRHKLSEKLSAYVGRLKIDWDVRSVRSWVQSAASNDKIIVDQPVVRQRLQADSEEGKRVWTQQLKIERDSGLGRLAKFLNIQQYGKTTCEACTFSHEDAGMFDAHHPIPLRLGIRNTTPNELEVLCPTCHRRAHRKGKLEPYSLAELKEWAASGRP